MKDRKRDFFEGTVRAEFISRPNRFLITASLEGTLVRAHCPNPGRLREILLPGRKLLLEPAVPKNKTGNHKQQRKTSYTLVAAEYGGTIIPLYSGRANDFAENLILPELFPDILRMKREVSHGNSRFDFLIESSEQVMLLEVKACTLIEEGVAMFPDAPSLRALRHLRELSQTRNPIGAVLFTLMNPKAEIFIPNFHTDPDFALACLKTKEQVKFLAASVMVNPRGEVELKNPRVPINLEPATLAEENRGIYCIIGRLKEEMVLSVGALGPRNFREGYYIYVGSAMANLRQRVARHLRTRKRKHWHIDYLLPYSSKTIGYPIYSINPLECSLAEAMSKISDDLVSGFGSSDCSCESHLFYFREDPLHTEKVISLLLLYRHRLCMDSSIH